MKVREKFRIGEGLLMTAFGMAVQGYRLTAVIFALAGVVTAWTCHRGSASKHIPMILAAGIIQMTIARMTSLYETMPMIGILIVCNTAAAFLFISAGREETETTVKVMCAAMLFFFAVSLALPSALAGFADTAVLVGLIFLPVQICYMTGYQILFHPARKLMEE